MSAAGDTKRLYRWEDEVLRRALPAGFFLHPITELRAWAHPIWHRYRFAALPKIIAGAGVPGPKRRSVANEWRDGTFTIELARHERCKAILLHELVHCLGYWDHGPAFRARYAEMLIEHLEWQGNIP